MAIRKNTNPQSLDLQPELQDILMRNGMQAHIMATDQGWKLVVQGHDSPMLSYSISETQLKALTDWGTNYANSKAYNTFAKLVEADFFMPRDFVHARNANGRVAMGLHGYRIGAGEYGRPLNHNHGWRAYDPGGYFRPFLGWTPRQQEGFHLRRVYGAPYYPGAPMVPNRPDGRMKPGELQNGGYGYYWKGSYNGGTPQQQQNQPVDVLSQLEQVVLPIFVAQRPNEPAKPYKQLINSDVYFSNDKWQEVLASHGIVIDPDAKTMTIQSKNVPVDMQYDLSEDELAKLTNNSIKDVPVAERLAIINNIIKVDFNGAVTMDMLNSDKLIDIPVKQQLNEQISQYLVEQTNANQNVSIAADVEQQQYVAQQVGLPTDNRQGVVDMNGNDLAYINPDKGWYREGRHGREVTVDDIRVEPTEVEGKYKMTAIIDGEVVSHEISQKQYDKFLAIDDYHRMKLFSKIFKEVDMKDRYPVGLGTKITAGLMAGLVVSGEISHALRGPRPMPEVYGECHHGSVYMKPGVDTPQDIAHRAFEAGMNTEHMRHDLHHGW